MSGYFARRAAVDAARWAGWRIRNREQLRQQREMRAYERMTDAEQLESVHRYITQNSKKRKTS